MEIFSGNERIDLQVQLLKKVSIKRTLFAGPNGVRFIEIPQHKYRVKFFAHNLQADVHWENQDWTQVSGVWE